MMAGEREGTRATRPGEHELADEVLCGQGFSSRLKAIKTMMDVRDSTARPRPWTAAKRKCKCNGNGVWCLEVPFVSLVGGAQQKVRSLPGSLPELAQLQIDIPCEIRTPVSSAPIICKTPRTLNRCWAVRSSTSSVVRLGGGCW